ncbi:hypothetical protein MHA01_27370 [Marinococcus halophilus]|uniref:Uncharacterized protein n=1 Tax=Marinococcus halophilus TaxID=1371 RepID=A0A510Y8X3_MARHA|nr:hypothetical protein MHA01_27370 [Marinococcus halophilus]
MVVIRLKQPNAANFYHSSAPAASQKFSPLKLEASTVQRLTGISIPNV